MTVILVTSSQLASVRFLLSTLTNGLGKITSAWSLAAADIVLAGRYAEAIAWLDVGATVRRLPAECVGGYNEPTTAD